ncbi:hypothetical protein VCRLGP8_1670010 [Vibrio crassostreae]|nr:hypothetical protein VCRLGP8_1670010 [Vibrio crassostreae]
MLLNAYSLLITRSSMISCEGCKVLSLLIKKPLMGFLLEILKQWRGEAYRMCETSELCFRHARVSVLRPNSIRLDGDLSIWPTVGQILMLAKS